MTPATPMLCDLQNQEHELEKDYPNYGNNDTLAEKQKLTIIEINKTIMEWKG